MKMILAGILLLVAFAFADEHPCNPPQQFMGTFQMFNYSIDTGKAQATYFNIYYDGINTRIRVEGKHDNVSYVVYQFFKEGKQYVVSGGHCYVMPVKGEFQRFDFPANASLVDAGRVGTSSEGLDIYRYTGIQHQGRYIATVTQEDCLLTNAVSLSQKNGQRYITYVSLTEVAIENDEEKFEKPTDCRPINVRRRRSTGGILDNPEENLGI